MKKGTRDAVSYRAHPEPWLIAPNGDALPIQLGNTLEGIYRSARNSDGGESTGPITVHDLWLESEDGEQRRPITIWGGPALTFMLADVARGEKIYLRYLGSYLTEFGPTAYRWQLWRELKNEAP